MPPTLLPEVKTALRIKTVVFDDEITDLIEAALLDLGVAGVVWTEDTIDPLIKRAVITYCRVHFGTPDDYDRMKRSYDEQKAQLATNTGHTDWRFA